MPPKGSGRFVHKRCPECRKPLPVATKYCNCGHQFFDERRKSTTSNNSEHDDGAAANEEGATDMKPGDEAEANSTAEGKRRSERVKREKPNFYDALEYENQMRKARKERRKDDVHITGGRVKRERRHRNNSDDDDEYDEPAKEKKKRKKKKKKEQEVKEEEEEIDEEVMAGISVEKAWQYGMVLNDINRKLAFNNPMFIKI